MRAFAFLSLASFALAGCSLDPAGESASLSAGDAVLSFDSATNELALTFSGSERVALPITGFRLGTVDAVDDETNYDPYRLWVPFPLWAEPPGLAFASAVRAKILEESDEALSIELDHGVAGTSVLSAAVGGDGRFAIDWTPNDARVAFFELGAAVGADEGFYGLGEVFDRVNHRGKIRAMQIEIDTSLESSYNEAHVPIPLVLGTRGWGLFVESAYPGAFDVASTSPTRVAAAFGTGPASADGLRFHLFAEARPLDLTKHYHAITGAPRLPAPWALGPWIWRDESADEAEVLADVQAIRDNDLAGTGYWIDRPYATAIQTFDFEAARFPDPPAIGQKLQELGFRGALWHAPYLDEVDPLAASILAEAQAAGYYPTDVGIPLNGWGTLLDLTNPAAVSFWQSHLGAYVDLGFSGFKLDYGEDVIVGPTEKREKWIFADGSDERTMHHGFPQRYHRTYADLFPEEGHFLLCRAGSFGDQTNGCVIWPGDLDASFAKHGEEVDEGGDSYVAVGGLPASIVAGLSLGASGFAFYGSDTGGYRHSPPDAELFARWCEQTALSPVMQVGNSANTVPWEPDAATGFDAQTLAIYRSAARLHLRLHPYLWTHAKRLAETGRGIMRPFGLVYPESGEHPDDVYLLGDALLVGAVTERGALTKELPIPPGEWVEVATGERFVGPQTITVDAPIERIPTLLRAGSLVPRLRPTIDSILPSTDPSVDTTATTPSELWVWAALPSEDDPGEPFATWDGIDLAMARYGSTLTLSASGANLPPVFEIVGFAAPPANVLADGVAATEAVSPEELATLPAGWHWSPDAGGTLYVRFIASASIDL